MPELADLTIPVLTIPVTPEQLNALGDIFDVARDDARTLIEIGDPVSLYGSEWRDTAIAKARTFRAIGDLGPSLKFYGDKESWYELADDYLRAADIECNCVSEHSWHGEDHASNCEMMLALNEQDPIFLKERGTNHV